MDFINRFETTVPHLETLLPQMYPPNINAGLPMGYGQEEEQEEFSKLFNPVLAA